MQNEGYPDEFGDDERLKNGSLERQNVALGTIGRWGVLVVLRKEQSEITLPTLKAFAIFVFFQIMEDWF